MRATCAAGGGGGIFIDWDCDNLNSSTHHRSPEALQSLAKSLFAQEIVHFEVDFLIIY